MQPGGFPRLRLTPNILSSENVGEYTFSKTVKMWLRMPSYQTQIAGLQKPETKLSLILLVATVCRQFECCYYGIDKISLTGDWQINKPQKHRR